MNKIRTYGLLTCWLLAGTAWLLPAQETPQPLADYLKKSADYIRRAEAGGAQLVYMHCDALPKDGEDPKMSLFDLKPEFDYEFKLEHSNEIDRVEIVVLDVPNTERVLLQNFTRSGAVTFKLRGHGSNAVVGLRAISYRPDNLQGFYYLVVTTRPASASPTPIIDPNCNLSAIKGLRFETRKQVIRKENGDKISERTFKSSVSIDGNLKNIVQKVNGATNEVYEVVESGCDPGGSFRLIVRNRMGLRAVIIINLNTQLFSLQDGTGQRVDYIMERIKKS